MNRLKNIAILLAALAMGILGSSLTSIVKADETTINACVNSGNGTFYKVAANTACGPNQDRLTWNITGPQGPAGPAGPTGPAGPAASFGTNLSSQDLRGLDLSFRFLVGANMSSAVLRLTNLSGSDLRNASLLNADLVDANLSNANLNGANLTNVNVYNTNLSSADLTNANLTGAHTPGSPPIVTGVIYGNTVCPDGTNSNNDGGTCSGHGMP
jgi:Pentapeptide repeats (8 copies)